MTDLSSVSQSEEALKEALTGLVGELGFDATPISMFSRSLPEPFRTTNWRGSKALFRPLDLPGRSGGEDSKSQAACFHLVFGNLSSLSSSELRRFYSEAAEFGICSGVSIPIRTACRHVGDARLPQTVAHPEEGYRSGRRRHRRSLPSRKITQLHAHPTAGRPPISGRCKHHLKCVIRA